MTLDLIAWSAPCEHGHPAAWVSTPTDGPRYTCAACDTNRPPIPVLTPPGAWSFRHQLRRMRGLTG